MVISRSIFVVALGLSATGCSTQVEIGPPGEGGGSNGSSSDQGGNTGTSCDGYDDEAEATVAVIVDNTSAQPLHIVTDRTTPPSNAFAIVDGGGATAATGWPDCSCERQQTSAQACSYSFGGPQWDIVTIMPGGQYEMAWDGRISEEVSMPSACFADQLNQQDECRRFIQAPPGNYTARLDVVVGTLEGCSDGVCTCPNGVAVCSAQSFAVTFDQSATLDGTFTSTDASVTLTP